MSEFENTTFDAIEFLDDLIREMGMENEDPKELALLKEQMAQALHETLFRAASQNVEAETIDMVMEDMKDEEDAWMILTEIVRTSPGAQVAMAEALEEFRTNTLEAYEELK